MIAETKAMVKELQEKLQLVIAKTKNYVEKQFASNWEMYTRGVPSLNDFVKNFKQATTPEEKEKYRLKGLGFVKDMWTYLHGAEDALGDVEDTQLIQFGIKTKVSNPQQTVKEAHKWLHEQEYFFFGLPTVFDDSNIDTQLENFKTRYTEFDKLYKAFSKETDIHKKDLELGKAASGVFSALQQYSKEIDSYIKTKTDFDLKSKDAKAAEYLDLVKESRFVAEFNKALRRDQKAVQLPKLESFDSIDKTLQYLKDKKADLTTFDASRHIDVEAETIIDTIFSDIHIGLANYQTFLKNGGLDGNVEPARDILNNVLFYIEAWQQEYEQLPETHKPAQKKAADYLTKILAATRENITALGALSINKDNFLELSETATKLQGMIEHLRHVIDRIDTHNVSLRKVQNKKKKETDPQKQEELQKKIDDLDNRLVYRTKQKRQEENEFRTELQAFSIGVCKWCENHHGKAFGLEKKRNTLRDWERDLVLAMYNLGLTPVELPKENPAKKFIPVPYDPAKDKLFKDIAKRKKKVEKELLAKDYEDAFKALGDLNKVLEQWTLDFDLYNADKDPAFKQAKTTVQETYTFFNDQFAVVTAAVSAKNLTKAMSKELEDYCEMVETYNESNPKQTDDFPKLMRGSLKLLEFIIAWEAQYKTLSTKGLSTLPLELKTSLEQRAQEYTELKNIIQGNNLVILSGMEGLKEGLENKKLQGETQEEIQTKQKQQDDNNKALTDKAKELSNAKIALERTKNNIAKFKKQVVSDGNVSEEEKNQLQELVSKAKEIEEQITELEDEKGNLDKLAKSISDELDTLQEKLKNLQDEDEQSVKTDATQIYMQLENLYTNQKDSFSFNTNIADDRYEVAARRKIINQILYLVSQWYNVVMEPKAIHVAHFTNFVDEVKRYAETQIKLFDARRETEDTFYESAKNAWDSKLANDDKNNTSKPLHEHFLYTQKLINYWLKENPTDISSSDTQKRTNLKTWLQYIEEELKGPRFSVLKLSKTAQQEINAVTEFIQDVLDDLVRQKNAIEGDKIYNVYHPETEDDVLKGINDMIHFAKKELAKVVTMPQNADASAYIRAAAEAKKHSMKFSDSYIKKQKALHQELVKREQMVFANIGETEIDFLHSTALPPEQFAIMNKTLENISNRATAVLRTTGSIKEAEKMFEHIPVNMWPDKFVSELQAFRATENAFKEEIAAQAREAVIKDNPKLAPLLDKPKEALAAILEDASDISEGSLFEKWNPESEEYESFYIGDTDTEQTDAHEKLDVSLATMTMIIDSVDFLVEMREKVKELKGNKKAQQKAAQDLKEAVQAYVFEGKEKDGKVSVAPNTREKEISDSKRAIFLTAIKFAGKVSKFIDDVGEDALPKGLQAVLKSANGFFELVAKGLEIHEDRNNWAKNTEECWNNRIDKFNQIAETLLDIGVGIAETAKIFGQIPVAVAPALGIASSALKLFIDIKGIAQKVILRNKTKNLQERAQGLNREYVDPLQQEIDSLNRRIAKQVIDAVADATELAGNIALVSGVGAPIGAAIIITAGVLKIANKLVFTGIDEYNMAECREILKKAQSGDRFAQREIMSKSPKYAKMFIAIGASETPPNPIALQFLLDRNITEHDLHQQGTDVLIVRKFVRTKLLEISEEKDNHNSRLSWFKKMSKTFSEWRARAKRKEGFWLNLESETFNSMSQIYPISKMTKEVNEIAEILKTVSLDVLNFYEAKTYKELPLFKDAQEIYRIFREQERNLKLQLAIQEEEKLKIEKDLLDKSAVYVDHDLLIEQVNRSIDTIQNQQKEMEPVFTSLTLLGAHQ